MNSSFFVPKKLINNKYNMKNNEIYNNDIPQINSNFAIIEKNEKVNIYEWNIHHLNNLSELEKLQNNTRNKIVFITPFCLVQEEKWYETHWEEQILAMEVQNEIETTREQLLEILPKNDINLWNIQSDISANEFKNIVKSAKEEIEAWNINQVVLSRQFSVKLIYLRILY